MLSRSRCISSTMLIALPPAPDGCRPASARGACGRGRPVAVSRKGVLLQAQTPIPAVGITRRAADGRVRTPRARSDPALHPRAGLPDLLDAALGEWAPVIQAPLDRRR